MSLALACVESRCHACAQHVAEGNDLEALMRMKADNSLLLGSIANAEQQLSTTITPAKTSPSR
jgi:ferredoxin